MGLLSVPLKTILMYHADLQNEGIPETYAVCDGTTLNSAQQDISGGSYTLPDLRNRFILGADITKAATTAGGTTNAASDAPGPKGAGGQHSKQLAIAELPAHTHTGTIATAGSHNHSGSTTDSSGSHIHTANTITAGAHTHAGSTSSTTGAHTHAGSSESSAGSHAHTVTDSGHVHSITDPGHVHGTYGGTNPNATGKFAILGVNSDMANNGYDATTLFTHSVNSATTGISINSGTSGITIVANGAHTHTLSITSDGNHSHIITLVSDGGHTHTVNIDPGGSHTHAVTLSTDGSHTHNFTGDTTGSGTAFDTRPRYYGVVFIMKVKI